MAKWLRVRRKWLSIDQLIPSDIDIIKSVLFERIRNGKEPLDFPPPIKFSYPWYDAIEDSGPHIVSSLKASSNSVDLYFNDSGETGKTATITGNGNPLNVVDATGLTHLPRNGDEKFVRIFQHLYQICQIFSPTRYTIKDAALAISPYRFSLWYDDVKGVWLMQYNNPKSEHDWPEWMLQASQIEKPL